MYLVKDVFRTLQGEGYWSGTPSVFVRLAGCNLWSGAEEHRARDASRNSASCPLWCDTDFAPSDISSFLEVDELVARVRELSIGSGNSEPIKHLVFTGGEPLMQLDVELLRSFRAKLPRVRLAVETNGTLNPRAVLRNLHWVCLSPKQPASMLKLRQAHELKVVFPSYNPLDYQGLEADHFFVQPEAPTNEPARAGLLEKAVTFCLENPRWRLSLQVHKWLEIP